jgi:hypothetical protein
VRSGQLSTVDIEISGCLIRERVPNRVETKAWKITGDVRGELAVPDVQQASSAPRIEIERELVRLNATT